jgi:hypothetical protein
MTVKALHVRHRPEDAVRTMNHKEIVAGLARAADSNAADNEPNRNADFEAELLHDE